MIGGLPPDYVDQWQDAARKADLDQLTAIRGTAEKWGATIGALTGIFGLIALVRGTTDVTKLTQPWNAIVAAAILLALVCAFMAIVAAAYAAQGSPVTQFADAIPFRNMTLAATRDARSRLRTSRRAAFVAMALILLAIIITWLAPQAAAAPSAYLVSPVNGSGAVRCGNLKTDDRGVVSLIVAGQQPVALRGAYAITPISKCP